MAGMAEAPAVCACGPTPAGSPGGGAGIGGKAGIWAPAGTLAAGPDCGPMPAGRGMGGMPGGSGAAFELAGLSRTKLRLCGKTSVSAPEDSSTRSTGWGRLVAVTSMRSWLVPTV